MTLALADRLPRPTAFVLGGGGSWGAIQLGALQAVAQTDLVPDFVVGTSVGSLNGAILAADPARAVERLAGIWPGMTRADVFPGGWVRSVRNFTATRTWIYDNSPLADLITAQIPVSTIEELAVPFTAIATDFTTGMLAELDSGDLRSALLASSAIPGIYPSVERDGHRLVDGGVIANIPIATALRRGARSMVVLDCGLPGVNSRRAGTLLDVLAQTVAIGARHHIAADLALCRTVPVLWLSRGRDNTTTVLDFTATADMIEQARVHSQTVLAAAAALPDLGPGLYGAGPELAVRSDIQALMR